MSVPRGRAVPGPKRCPTISRCTPVLRMRPWRRRGRGSAPRRAKSSTSGARGLKGHCRRVCGPLGSAAHAIGSCTRPLRIIPLVRQAGTMPSYHHDLREHCQGVTPVLLPTRSVGAPLALHHVASQLARAKRAPANPASPAQQAQAFPRAHSVRGPAAQASLCVVCTRDRGDQATPCCPARADAPHAPPPSYRGDIDARLSP